MWAGGFHTLQDDARGEEKEVKRRVNEKIQKGKEDWTQTVGAEFSRMVQVEGQTQV